MSYETRYTARMRQQASEYADSAKGMAERERLQEAMDCVKSDVAKKYPIITVDKIEEVEAYRQSRIDYHRSRLSA